MRVTAAPSLYDRDGWPAPRACGPNVFRDGIEQHAVGLGVPMVTNQLPPKAGDLMGRRIADFVIDGLIGEGGMGAVYSAYSPLLDMRAAIKVMLSEFTEQRDVVERFFREAKAVARVCDPNVITISAAGRFPEDGRMYIVMPFIEGGSLEALCRRMGPMPLDVAAAIVLQVASGLDAIHEVAIVHRDIKAQNILITSRYRRKFFPIIVDFGIAKLLDPHIATFTRTKAIIGTAGSMAPEQARGQRDIDARADIYSLGTVLYRMLTGRPVYEEQTLYALIEAQVKGAPFPRPSELRRDIPPIWDDTIMSALQIDRNRRPRSMRDFAKQLAKGIPGGEKMMSILAPQLCADMPLGPTEATLTGGIEASIARWTIDTKPPSTRRMILPLAATMIAGVAVGGTTAVLVAGHHDTSPAAIEPRGSGLEPASTPIVADAREVTIAADAAAVPVNADATIQTSTTLDAGPGKAPVDAGAPATPHVEHPRPPPPPVEVAKTGVLSIKVRPFAEVYIDDVSAGTTPVKKTLSTGVHRVKLVGGEKQEELSVTINPAKETTITRSW